MEVKREKDKKLGDPTRRANMQKKRKSEVTLTSRFP